MRREHLFEVGVGNVVAQISDVQFLAHFEDSPVKGYLTRIFTFGVNMKGADSGPSVGTVKGA
jgi:hypothetical protein